MVWYLVWNKKLIRKLFSYTVDQFFRLMCLVFFK